MSRPRTPAILPAVFAAILLAASAASAQSNTQDRPLPRFVSLKSHEVNARAGPGTRYPVKWKYVRLGLPVEIIAEYETWRKIRDWEGAESWVHSAMVTGKRRVMVTGKTRTLHRRADEAAPAVVRLKPGIIAEIEDCGATWCRVEVRNYRGWLKRGDVWGLYPGEEIK